MKMAFVDAEDAQYHCDLKNACELVFRTTTGKLLALTMLEITLYTKDNCSLCLKARRVLQDFQQRHAFRLAEVDITTDENLHERYKHDIPVATWNGEEIFHHRIDTKAFEMFLKERIETL